MTIQKRLLSTLVEDLSIYPRTRVDEQHVRDLRLAHESGVKLPPPIVEDSGRIVDGVHRVRMYRNLLGDEGSIRVDVRSFDSDLQLLQVAAQLNTEHGLRLSRIDQVRVIHLLDRAGADQLFIAQVLHVPEERVVTLRLRTAEAPGGEAVPLKASVIHLRQSQFTSDQESAHRRAPGTSYTLVASQLLDALRQGFIDPDNEKLMVRLGELYQELGGFLGAGRAIAK